MTLSRDELFEIGDALFQKGRVVYKNCVKALKASDLKEAHRMHRLHTELKNEHAEILEMYRKLRK